MTEFQLSEQVKKARLDRGLSQKALADAVGCHPSFITKVEKLDVGGSLPSRELSDAMAGALGLNPDALWKDVEDARTQMTHRRLRRKGAAVEQTMLRRGIPVKSSMGKPALGPSLEDEVAGITVDPAVLVAVRTALPHLVTAMTDPEMRQVIDTALRGWAQLAQKKKQKNRH